MISLLRSIISSARSRNSRAFFWAYSLPSSAFDARYSRVSSPDLGANRMPSNVPTPSPTRKKLTFEPTLLSLTAHLQYEANMAVARRQLFAVSVVTQFPVTRLIGTCPRLQMMTPCRYVASWLVED